jgi:hypothetical protein
MKNLLITVFIALELNLAGLHAQNAMFASGGVGSGTGGSISYTIGQVGYKSNSSTGGLAALGIQQPFEMFGFTVNGFFTYNNYSHTPLDSVWLYLKMNGSTLDSARTDLNGYYRFKHVKNGFYNIIAHTGKAWNGVNSTDAVKVKLHFSGSDLLTSTIILHCADVNLTFSINTTDAVKITRRFVGTDTSFMRGDWAFEKPLGGDTLNVSPYNNDTIIVNRKHVAQDFYGLCVGDVNGSNFPYTGAKFLPKVYLDYNNSKKLSSGETFELPLSASGDLSVGAISLILGFPKELIQIENVQLIIDNKRKNLDYNVKSGLLRIGWFETEGALNLTKDKPFMIIKLRTSGNFKPGDLIKFKIENSPLCEFADEKGEPINSLILNTSTIGHINTLYTIPVESSLGNDMIIFPNPANDVVNINYFSANDGFVKIELYNVLGEKIIDIVNTRVLKGNYYSQLNLSSVQPGVYTCIMKQGDKNSIIKRLIISN